MASHLEGTTIERLASTIEHDIRRRGLTEGQPYLTAESVGELHGVHVRTANRAMAHLAERGVLVRRRGAGTFVGPKAVGGVVSPVKLIHVAISQDRLQAGFQSGPLMRQANRLLAGCDMQWNVLPPHGAAAHLGRIIDSGLADGTLEGMILIACPRAVQEAVLERGVPAVVFGGVYASTSSLVSIDHDQYQIGFQLAEHLVHAGRESIGVAMRETRLPGDDRFIQGVHHALAEGGLGFGALTERSVPTEVHAAKDELRCLLESSSRPSAMICRNAFFAQTTLQVADDLHLQTGNDIDVVFDGSDHCELKSSGMTSIRSAVEPDQEAELLIHRLQALISREGGEIDHETIDVNLVVGDGHAVCT